MTLFYHIAGINNYKEVTEEIFSSVISSNLLYQLDKVVVSFVGKKEDFDTLDFPIKDAQLIYSGKLKEYEYPTIKLLQEHCKANPTDIVLYCHSKGVSNPDSTQKKYWRKAMVKHTIDNWKQCVEYLKEFELVGYNWCGNHFSGNFWWANAAVINETKPINSFKDNYIFVSPNITDEENYRCQPEFFLSKLDSTKKTIREKWLIKSVGTENYDYRLVPVCIELEDIGNEDPFDYAGIKIDKRYLINLQTRPDRKKKTDILLKYLNIRDVKTIPAINGRLLGIDNKRVGNPGIAACYLTWLSIFNVCYAEGYETVLMLEDDVLFQYGFKELLKENWKNVPDDWDMVWIGGYERYGIPGRNIAGNVYLPKDMWGTHCMIYSKKGIEKIVRTLNNKPITADIDIEITRHIPDFNQYQFFPSIALQNGWSLSDIRGEHIK
jgi:GR25 family glycosyltransferase involved in LPS biosynthesis